MKPCPYCGNNPVSHPVHKFYESLDILLSPIRRNILQSSFGRMMDKISEWVALGFFGIIKSLGLVKINRDIKNIQYDRARVLWEEATRRGIEIDELKPFGKSIDLYRAKLKGKFLYFMNLPRTEKVTTSNLTWID